MLEKMKKKKYLQIDHNNSRIIPINDIEVLNAWLFNRFELEFWNRFKVHEWNKTVFCVKLDR